MTYIAGSDGDPINELYVRVCASRLPRPTSVAALCLMSSSWTSLRCRTENGVRIPWHVLKEKCD